MKKNTQMILLVAALLLSASCADVTNNSGSKSEVRAASDEESAPTASSETEVPETSHSSESIPTDTASAEPTMEEHPVLSEREALEKDLFSHDFIQFDMNYDGIPEDFFLLEGGYEMFLYRDDERYHSFTIPRTDKIDIYRQNLSDDPDQPDYRYWFTCLGGTYKKFSLYLTYVGSGTDKSIGGTGYGEILAPYIGYHEYNSSMTKEDFELLISDPLLFLNERRYKALEYVETINLEDMANSGCIRSFLYDLKPLAELENIEVYALENDAFGKEIMISNGKYSVYLSDFDSVELYERNAPVLPSIKWYEEDEIKPRGELDYLLCFRSSEGSTECVYLGTARERYLFPYNFGVEESFSVISPEELQTDGWISCGKLELPAL